jgi:hypothetical protein
MINPPLAGTLTGCGGAFWQKSGENEQSSNFFFFTKGVLRKRGKNVPLSTNLPLKGKCMDMDAMDDAGGLFREIVALSGVARDALVTSHGTGIGAQTGVPVQWWIIRKTNNDAPRGKPRRTSHTWWALSQCLETGTFEDAVAADVDQARARLGTLVRWPVATAN